MNDRIVRWGNFTIRQLRNCTRKHRFETFREARRTRGAHITPPMNIYQCEVCGGWHLGHPIQKQMEAK